MEKRLYRLLASLLLCTVLATGLTVSTSAVGFADVPADHWAADEIQRCVELGFFKGESAVSFGTGRPMTRSAFAVVLCRFFGWKTATPAQQTYPDVPLDAWYAGAVEAAYTHGALTEQQKTFRPNAPITREELAVTLVRALGYGPIAGLAQDLPMPFEDVTTNAGYITMAHDLGLMNGISSTMFAPARTASREQVAVILIRLYDKLHGIAPGKMGLLTPDEELPDLTGLEAVAISSVHLLRSSSGTLSAATEAPFTTLRDAAQQAGTKAILHVTCGASALGGDLSKMADTLAEAVKTGGYDGVLLDIPTLNSKWKTSMTTFVQALKPALEDKLLFLTVEAPVRQGTQYDGYDYPVLGATADRLVLRIRDYEQSSNGFPIAPVAPLEEVYYAFDTLSSLVDSSKLSLMLTTSASSWVNGRKSRSLSAVETETLLAEGKATSHYSDRYACAYLTDTTGDLVAWYLNEQAISARIQLAQLFSIDQVCLADLRDLPPNLLSSLQ